MSLVHRYVVIAVIVTEVTGDNNNYSRLLVNLSINCASQFYFKVSTPHVNAYAGSYCFGDVRSLFPFGLWECSTSFRQAGDCLPALPVNSPAARV